MTACRDDTGVRRANRLNAAEVEVYLALGPMTVVLEKVVNLSGVSGRRGTDSGGSFLRRTTAEEVTLRRTACKAGVSMLEHVATV